MLLVQENTMKLGGVKLPGQVEKISVSETASIEDIQDDKGKTKANQPTGYEAAKVSVKIILEDSEKMTIAQQITTYQRLFKPYGQTKAKLLKLVGEDFSTRGISKVHFKQLTHDNTISQSGKTATLEFVAPTIAGIKTKKKSSSGSNKSKKNNKNGKSKKNTGKSPTKNKRNTANAKSKARQLTK